MNFRIRSVFWLQLGVLVLLVFPFVSPTFRDNDQAAILSGAWQIAHHQISFVGPKFYNYDKQWGTFLVLSWLFRLWPEADPVLVANLLVTILASLAWLSLGLRTGRTARVPVPLLLPFLLSPVLVLYMPYLGTGWFSLALLLLAFFFFGSRTSKGRAFGLLFLIMAAACRGDVILAVPALFFSQVARRRLSAIVRNPMLWAMAAGAIAPVVLGKRFAGVKIPDTNPLSFDLRVYIAFLVFGFTLAVLLLLVAHTAVFANVARQKPRFRWFYAFLAVAPLIPLGFYSGQMYTLRYLFLSLASLLFAISSRRSAWLFRRWPQRKRKLSAALLVSLTILPWLLGIRAPELRHLRPTLTNPTRFPTGDGKFPMGAYLAFLSQVRFRDHLVVDHNQKIWQSARSTNFEACGPGSVPLLITPMSNFLEFAIRLQNKEPLPIDYLAKSPCGAAYVDARSILRGIRPDVRDGDFFSYGMQFVSSTNNGQLIVRVDSRAPRTRETVLLKDVRDALAGRESDLFTSLPPHISVEAGSRYLIYSEKPCWVSFSGPIRKVWTAGYDSSVATTPPECIAPFSGWARTTLPPYMGL